MSQRSWILTATLVLLEFTCTMTLPILSPKETQYLRAQTLMRPLAPGIGDGEGYSDIGNIQPEIDKVMGSLDQAYGGGLKEMADKAITGGVENGMKDWVNREMTDGAKEEAMQGFKKMFGHLQEPGQEEDIEEEDERVGDLRSPELALNGEDGDEDVTPEDKEYMGQDLLDKADYEPEDWDIHSHTHIHPDVKQGPAIGRKSRLGNAPALLDSEKLLISKASASMIRDSDRSSGHSGSGILGSASELVQTEGNNGDLPEQFGGPNQMLKKLGVDQTHDVYLNNDDVGVPLYDKALDTRHINDPDPDAERIDEEDINVGKEPGTELLPVALKIWNEYNGHQVPSQGTSKQDFDRGFKEGSLAQLQTPLMKQMLKGNKPDPQSTLDLENLIQQEDAKLGTQLNLQTETGTEISADPVNMNFEGGFHEGQRTGLKKYKKGVREGFSEGYGDGFNFAFEMFSRGYQKGYEVMYPQAETKGEQDVAQNKEAAGSPRTEAESLGVDTNSVSYDPDISPEANAEKQAAENQEVAEEAQEKADQASQGTDDAINADAANVLNGAGDEDDGPSAQTDPKTGKIESMDPDSVVIDSQNGEDNFT